VRLAAHFFQSLGFELELDTGHNSGQLRNGTGPYVFIAEVPEARELHTQIVMRVPDADAFHPELRRRGGEAVRGHPLRHEGNDRTRPRRTYLDPAGSRQGVSGRPGQAGQAAQETVKIGLTQ
jgi:hypothetical protein